MGRNAIAERKRIDGLNKTALRKTPQISPSEFFCVILILCVVHRLFFLPKSNLSETQNSWCPSPSLGGSQFPSFCWIFACKVEFRNHQCNAVLYHVASS